MSECSKCNSKVEFWEVSCAACGTINTSAQKPVVGMPTATEHPLHKVFMAAIEQAMYGKGERHGGAKTPFLEQPWAHYAEMHGRGFLTGQAAKKLEEAASTREGKAFETEVFGAMVYLGMAIIHERSKK